MGAIHGFSYESTDQWQKLNTANITGCDVLIFLDSRPEDEDQREVFKSYMENGGAWIGFHFAAFALTPSDFPQDWDWYHNDFLGSGQYMSNTWRPTEAILKIENRTHPSTAGLPEIFKSAPNEWYRWQRDIRKNPDISILASIDPSSFPLGTGPKPHEIWHTGYYPVAWTNKNYRMVYFNMGHNDIDYEGGTNETLSHTFSSEFQNRMILQSLKWLGRRAK